MRSRWQAETVPWAQRDWTWHDKLETRYNGNTLEMLHNFCVVVHTKLPKEVVEHERRGE